jgi:branched-chain amino acid transport system permease protein
VIRRAAARDLLKLAATGVVVAVVPQFVTSLDGRFVATLALLYAMLAVSWNLTLGLARIFNFAHIAFFAAGAYASAILTTRLTVSPWLGIPAAAVTGAILGAIAFLPMVRLRGIYVALITFVFSQLCFYLVLDQTSLTGGSNGLVGLPSYQIGSHVFAADGNLGYYYTSAVLLVVALMLLVLITRSSVGRGLVALRDNETYALARGVPAFRLRLIAFVASASIAGVTGAVYAHFIGVVSPQLFGFTYSALVLSMVVVGGLNTVYGPLLGAVAITLLSNQLKNDGPWQFIVVSAVILVVLWFVPEGVAGVWDQLRTTMRRLNTRGGDELESVGVAKPGVHSEQSPTEVL